MRTVGAKPGIETEHPQSSLVLIRAEHSLYLIKEFKAQQVVGYKSYMMVQPAFVVVDKTGSVRQVWSWNTHELKDLKWGKVLKWGEDLTPVPSFGGAHLVTVRPDPSDILPSIKEDRRVMMKVHPLKNT